MQVETYSITKDRLLALFKKLSEANTLIAPVKNEFEEVLLFPVEDAYKICFDYQLTLNSAKDYFLPSSEPIFSYSYKSGSVKIADIDEQEEIFIHSRPLSISLQETAGFSPRSFIFGLRPCDAKAVRLLDEFFKRRFEDNLYLRRRKASLIMSFACNQYGEDCFCHSTNTDMILEEGFDFQLIAIDKDKFLLQVGSKEAGSFLRDFGDYLSVLSEEEKEKLKLLKSGFKKSKPVFDFKKVYRNLKDGKVKDEIWQDIASRCQRCGLCLFICPTCGCFTMLERLYPDGLDVERIRQWDACYFKGFTRLAGGENPVKTDEDMNKRKYIHKFVQQFDEFGMSGCTGCGRCVKCCVGNVDWLKNITEMQ